MFNSARLKELRIAKNFTQEELGKLLGITKAEVSMIEAGKRNPKVSTIIEMMLVFNVTSDYLLGADSFIKDYKNPDVVVTMMTKEEIAFINELQKHKEIYDILIPNPKRGMDLINKKIG